MKLRLTRPYEGWLFVFPPSSVKIGSVLKFEGSWQGYSLICEVVGLTNENFGRKQTNTVTISTDRVRLRSTSGGDSFSRTVINVCYSARWSLRVDEGDAA